MDRTEIKVLYDDSLWVENFVTSVDWSGENGSPYRTLTVSMMNTINGDDQVVNFELGKELKFYADNVGIFRGVIFSYDVSESGSATITAHDENVYLTKNADTRKFVGMTASSILRDICTSFGIPTGTIADTGYVIPRVIFHDTDAWSMIAAALVETRKHNGRKFRVTASNGKVNLIEKKDSVVRWVIEDGVNILTANRTRSIEDMRTSVKVVSGDEEKPLSAVSKDAALATKYGTMQHIETADSKANKSQLEQIAKQRLKELGKINEEVFVEAFGNVEVVAGTAVYAFESMTELVGGFYVTEDRHSFENGVHRMNITLSRTDDLPKVGFEDAFEEVKVAKKSAIAKTRGVNKPSKTVARSTGAKIAEG